MGKSRECRPVHHGGDVSIPLRGFHGEKGRRVSTTHSNACFNPLAGIPWGKDLVAAVRLIRGGFQSPCGDSMGKRRPPNGRPLSFPFQSPCGDSMGKSESESWLCKRHQVSIPLRGFHGEKSLTIRRCRQAVLRCVFFHPPPERSQSAPSPPFPLEEHGNFPLS